MVANILIGLAIFLLLCIKAVRKLLRLVIWMPIWYVVYYFLCRPKLTIFILAFGLGMAAYKGVEIIDWVSQFKPLPAQQQAQTPQVQPLQVQRVKKLPPIIGKLHDGNSNFAEDMLPKLLPPELAAYSGEFYEAILNGKDNVSLKWKLSDKTFGQITPRKRFVSNGGSQCRGYHEILSVNGYAQAKDEVACEQEDKKGWCRLSPAAIPSCEIGYSSSWDRTVSGVTNFFSNW